MAGPANVRDLFFLWTIANFVAISVLSNGFASAAKDVGVGDGGVGRAQHGLNDFPLDAEHQLAGAFLQPALEIIGSITLESHCLQTEHPQDSLHRLPDGRRHLESHDSQRLSPLLHRVGYLWVESRDRSAQA